ncbi:MAG: RNA polymerase sigma factor, partial [Bacillota bacterium]
METTELCTQRSAQELLAEFKATGREEPFEEIVRRYAGMVYHVCLQVTKNNHDAEDVTQAVFLTLAVQAKTSKEIRCLGPWLQQVGHRLALDLRKSKKRRQAREEKHSLIQQYTNPCYEQPAPLDQEELRFIINEELNKLPAKYRLPLVLYYFGGLSRDAMAKELHLKVGTLGARLHRGRAMLGTRLAERGVLMAEGSLSMALMYSVQSTITDALIANTCQAATQYVACGDLNVGVLPIQVVGLVKNAVRAAILAKLKTLGIVLLVAGTAVAAGAEVVSRSRPLDLHLNLPSELGDRVLPLLQPIPIPRFSDATPKAQEPQSPVPANTALANQTTRGLLREGGGPGFSIDYLGSGSTWSSLAGNAGPVAWLGTSSGGVLPYAFEGSGVGAKHSASLSSGPVLQASVPGWSGRGGAVNSWVANCLSPQPINGVGTFRSATALGSGGMATGWRQQATVARASGGYDSKTQTPGETPGSGGSGPIIKPVEPPVVQNPPPSGPPGSPGSVPIIPPIAPPPVVDSGALASVVVNPTHIGQVASSPTSSGYVPSTTWNSSSGTGSLVFSDTRGTTGVLTGSQSAAGVDAYEVSVGTPFLPTESGGRVMCTTDTVRGYGKSQQVGLFTQNGQVIADGYGARQTLDLSAVSAIENSIDNPVQRGTNGWYA